MLFRADRLKSTINGFVRAENKELTLSYHLVHVLWSPTVKIPPVYFTQIGKPVVLRPKRFIILISGRGSGKTLVKGDHGLIGMHDLGRNLMCIREFQYSITASVHAVLRDEIKRIELYNNNVSERTVKITQKKSMTR